jgi:hypothetical protein
VADDTPLLREELLASLRVSRGVEVAEREEEGYKDTRAQF